MKFEKLTKIGNSLLGIFENLINGIQKQVANTNDAIKMAVVLYVLVEITLLTPGKSELAGFAVGLISSLIAELVKLQPLQLFFIAAIAYLLKRDKKPGQ